MLYAVEKEVKKIDEARKINTDDIIKPSAELAEMLEGGEETTMEKAKENAMDTLRLLFEQDFDI